MDIVAFIVKKSNNHCQQHISWVHGQWLQSTGNSQWNCDCSVCLWNTVTVNSWY